MPLPKDRNAVAKATYANTVKPGKLYSIQRAFVSMGGEVVWSEIAQCDDEDNAEWIADSLNKAEREQRRKSKAVVIGLHTSG